MTVNVRVKAEDNAVFLAASGHAGFGEAGKDIVCAGVSSLFMAYIGCLRDLNTAGKLSSLEIIKGDGELSVFSGGFLSEESKREVYLHTYFLITGISLISQQYPDHVRLGEFF